jgi:hypothetical protein
MIYLVKLNLLIAFLLPLSAFAQSSKDTVKPTEIWPDNNGNHVQAHSGGIIKVGKTYYWFGEDRSKDNEPDMHYVA